MIIVTGGAGFIGSNLVAALDHSQKHPIIVCDVLGQDEKWQNLKRHNIADLIPPQELFIFLEKNVRSVKAVFHMGAISTTTERDADLIMTNNFKLSMQLLEWCSQNAKRLIYASSAATYGDGNQGFEDHVSSEALANLVPLNAYAWSKHLFDRRLISMHDHSVKLPPQWVGLKFFNVYGPNEYHKGSQKSVVNHLYHTIQKGESAKLFKSYKPEYPDGGQQRDFVWIDDCINVMLWLLEKPEVSGIFNVGSGRARSFDDLARAVFTALDKTPQITYVDMPEGLAEKYQYFTEASTSKLKSAGYQKPFTSLEEGVKQYVQGFLMQHDPYR